jgi:ferredoxin
MGEDGKAEVINEDIPDDALNSAKEAEEGCPVSVIGISQFD